MLPFEDRSAAIRKLNMLHGMADPIIPYQSSLAYYQAVNDYFGGIEKTKEFFRYFLVPGFDHTLGGPGVQDIFGYGFRATPQDREHDSLTALSDWVKFGIAPERLLAVAFEDGNILNGIIKDHYAYERPCYAYPDHPEFQGGDVNDPGCYETGTV
ncbi:MAG: tannase/feruloyl esterase family alpha/beta hydrolase [Lachnospiraceae bacterium]|nr:tannase/feruloyl esterase family alpha/beta hydrolase [Lachnospiraceae bacterium]